jgi:hypothetical protein
MANPVVTIDHDRAVAVCFRVGPQHHGHHGLALTVPLPNRRQIHIRQDIGIDDAKGGIAQYGFGLLHGTGRTEYLWFIGHVHLLESPLPAIAEPLPELVGVVMQVDDHFLHMGLSKLGQQVAEYRL